MPVESHSAGAMFSAVRAHLGPCCHDDIVNCLLSFKRGAAERHGHNGAEVIDGQLTVVNGGNDAGNGRHVFGETLRPKLERVDVNVDTKKSAQLCGDQGIGVVL